jgi:hypothetical protein
MLTNESFYSFLSTGVETGNPPFSTPSFRQKEDPRQKIKD